MVEIGRRGFLTGLVALIAAPAVIRVAPLMPISTRHMPLYVPIDWLSLRYGMEPLPLKALNLEAHAWPRPLGETWVDLNDPAFVHDWADKLAREIDEDPKYWWS